jgi:two-component system, OmpR family, sensor kinase
MLWRDMTGRRHGWRFGLRTRVVAWFGVLLLLAVLGSLAAARSVLLNRLDARLDDSLSQEADELRALVDENDPGTGEPLSEDIRQLFRVFLERNVPLAHEAIITFVDGEPFLRSSPVVPYRLDLDPEIAGYWSRVRTSERGTLQTPAGAVRYLALPIRVDGETEGVYVGAFFRDLEQDEVNDALMTIALVGLVALAAACVLAAGMADRILRPVRSVTATARRISETDLSQRLPVDSKDEIGTLATTLNGMLARLEEAFETQRRFIDDAGHELRTPLTIVQGHLEQLGDDPQEREETLALVLDELDRMSRLVRELLLLARADRPDFLDLGVVDVRELTTEALTKASALGARDWALDGAAQVRIVADRQRLTQAMMQLAENAVRQTEEGATVAVGSAAHDGEARLWVRDSGPGVPPEDQPHLFERFRRGGNRRGEGSGLGLSIVQAVAQAHGGRVELHSRPGAGATFTLVLPTEGPAPADPASTVDL